MAQSIVGTQLYDRWQDTNSRPALKVSVDWGKTGAFVDESEHIKSIDITHSLYDSVSGLPALGRVGPETATIIMDNSSRRFSPNNPLGLSGTYPNLLNGIYRIPIEIEMGYYNSSDIPEYTTQFVGEIESSTEREQSERVTSTFGCVGKGVELMQHKSTSVVFSDIRTDEFVLDLLISAGLVVYDLDMGNNEIPYAWVDDENLWEEILLIAEAEGALFYFDKEGRAMFKRLTAFLERPDSVTPVVELNDGNAIAYSDGITWRDCYNEVVVEWATRYQGMQADVYTAPSTIVVPPNTTITEELRYKFPVTYAVPPHYGEDYVAVTSGARTVPYGPTGIENHFVGYGQKGIHTIANRMSRHTLYVMNLRVRGFPLIGDEAQQERFQSPLGIIPGDKVYEYRDNPYLQTPEQAYRIGGYLSDWLERPRRIYTWRGPAIPWIEHLDRVTLKHNVMSPNPGTNVDCYVIGITQRYRMGGFYEQELLLLPVQHFFAYDNYFIVGQSLYLDIGSDEVAY